MKTIKTNGNNGKGKVALVDNEDKRWLSMWSWYLHSNGYAAARIKGKIRRMHELLIYKFPDYWIDHTNGNPLDNRKENLRLATKSQNGANSKSRGGTSKYKGVYWHKANKKWCANIRVNHKKHNLGSFADEIEAAKAYDEAAKEHFGEFARLNFSIFYQTN